VWSVRHMRKRKIKDKRPIFAYDWSFLFVEGLRPKEYRGVNMTKGIFCLFA
jgi:hypothetical protein